MKVNVITSLSNPLLKKIRSLHERRGREKTGLFLIEGCKALGEAFDKRIVIEEIVVSQTYFRDNADRPQWQTAADVFVVEDKSFAYLSGTIAPEGVLAVAKTPVYAWEDLFAGATVPLVVLGVAVQDPGNLGTLIRSALAARSSGMILTEGSVDPFNPKVVRSAMGALFALPMICDVSFDEAAVELKKRQVKMLGCQPGAAGFYFNKDLTQSVAIVLGNEAQGLSSSQLAQCDEATAVPMSEQSESLNVAVCGSIVLFSAVEQRMKAGMVHGSG